MTTMRALIFAVVVMVMASTDAFIFGLLGPRPGAPAKKAPCPVPVICKKIREVQAKLKQSTAAMTTQGKMIAGRLDQAEAKIQDIGNIGKKLTDLLAQQGSKIQEQGAKLAAEETKISDELKTQLSTFETKMTSYTARMTAMSEKTMTLTDHLSEQDTKIGALQTEGVKILDKLAGATKKVESKITQQTAKMGALLPLPDGKFTEIANGHKTCAEKMAAFQAKFEAMQAAMGALKEKLGGAEAKLASVEADASKLVGKADAVEADIEAQEQISKDLSAKLGENDAKMGEVAAQGSSIADSVAASIAKVGGVAAAKLKFKEKLGKQLEAASAIKEQALSLAGKMKEHESKLGKVQNALDEPKEPAAPAGN